MDYFKTHSKAIRMLIRDVLIEKGQFNIQELHININTFINEALEETVESTDIENEFDFFNEFYSSHIDLMFHFLLKVELKSKKHKTGLDDVSQYDVDKITRVMKKMIDKANRRNSVFLNDQSKEKIDSVKDVFDIPDE